MIRGEVYDARLDPVEGSEQGGIRPAVIVSRNQLNAALQTVVVVPCSSYRPGRRIYAAQVLLRAPEGGLRTDSVVLGEQVRVLGKHRLLRRRGTVSPQALAAIDRILAIALDLPGQV
jgi:mRNA interferase MazF